MRQILMKMSMYLHVCALNILHVMWTTIYIHVQNYIHVQKTIEDLCIHVLSTVLSSQMYDHN